MFNQERFYDNVKILAINNKMTIKELLNTLNVNSIYFSNLVSRQNMPRLDIILKLCVLFGVSFDELMKDCIDTKAIRNELNT